MGNANAAIIELSETYLVTMRVMTNTPIQSRVGSGLMAKYQSKQGGYSFSAAETYIYGENMTQNGSNSKQKLKFNKITCFRNVIIGKMYQVYCQPAFENINYQNGQPAFQPNTRMAFVAPAFLLPCSRISIPKNDFPIQTDVGTEPIK